jgi:hypothetical protein
MSIVFDSIGRWREHFRPTIHDARFTQVSDGKLRRQPSCAMPSLTKTVGGRSIPEDPCAVVQSSPFSPYSMLFSPENLEFNLENFNFNAVSC